MDNINAITDEVLLKNGFLYKNHDNSHISSLYKHLTFYYCYF